MIAKEYPDFLQQYEADRVEQILTNPEFPWYLNRILYKVLIAPEYNYQMNHSFYLHDTYNSPYKELIDIFRYKLNWVTLVKCRANLIFRTDKIVQHGWHTDFNDPRMTTALYYVNTNNGYTIFEDTKEKHMSIKNKFIEFPTLQSHAGTTCTDAPYRICINFNYYKQPPQ